MRKVARLASGAVLATLLAAVLMPATAFADDETGETPSLQVKDSSKSLTEKQETEDKHREIEGIYKNPGRISLPPILIRPIKPHETVAKTSQDYVAVAPKVSGSLVTEPNAEVSQPAVGTSINPIGGVAIDISQMNPESKTPAETFIEAAYVGLGAMGVGALVLAVTASARAFRRK